MLRIRPLYLLLLISLLFSCRQKQDTSSKASFEDHLKTLFEDAEITKLGVKDHFKECFHLVINSPYDYSDPSIGTFKHHIYVSHVDFDNPTLLITDGYSSTNRSSELSKILRANQIIVEYRMYGESRPDSIPWEHLTNDNAVEDYHSIVKKLKEVYQNKWISSGFSKGGETALIYKSKYPNDVDVVVPYVAPLINGLEDPRTWDLIHSVGDETCRKKTLRFQRNVLINRDEILPLLAQYAEENQMTFVEVPLEEALEYAVLEFPFSFWQSGGNCSEIPSDTAGSKTLFDYINKSPGLELYADEGYYYYLPSFYQHMKELGYYGFDLNPVKDLLQIVKSSSNDRFAPKGIDLSYNPDYIKNVRDFVESKGDRILYIYGGNDPWGACAPKPQPHVDALKMVLENGHHGTKIVDFSQQDREKIYAKLQEWLGEDLKIYPL